VNDYVAVLESVERVTDDPGLSAGGQRRSGTGKDRIDGEHDAYYADPLFIIRDQKDVGRISSEIGELGVKLTLINIHPDSNEFTLGINGRQKDWVIIKAMEKPYINVLWLGTVLLMIGFTTAMVRRFRE